MRRVSRFSIVLFLAASMAASSGRAQGPNSSEDWFLFSYFIGNGEDGLHLAASRDGLRWDAVGGGQSFLKPELGRETLMRDPSLVRAPDGMYHMVWTTSWKDLVIGYAHSKDLIHWSKQRAIPVMAHEPTARNCWAPELFYDAPSRRYFIVWSTTIPKRFAETAGSSEDQYNHRVYYTTTRDFEQFAPTKLYFDPGHNVIDAFLTKDDGKYLLFYKDETKFPEPKKTIHFAVAERPEGPFGPGSKPISPLNWIEGPSAIKIGGAWIVYFDCYMKGRYGAATSKDLKDWTDISDQLRFPPGARHGTVFRADRATVERLEALGK